MEVKNEGTTKDFSYQNLSAGEKSAFDLILDMVVQSKYYPDAVYCIDEPELHMHTKLQGKVLRELYLLIPGQSQLWVSTHSIGMLQEAEDIEKANPGTVVFLDFGYQSQFLPFSFRHCRGQLSTVYILFRYGNPLSRRSLPHAGELSRHILSRHLHGDDRLYI